MVICLEQGADCLHMVKLTPQHPKPHHLLPHLNPDWFYLSGTGLPRLSWERGRYTRAVVVVVVKELSLTSPNQQWGRGKCVWGEASAG